MSIFLLKDNRGNDVIAQTPEKWILGTIVSIILDLESPSAPRFLIQ